MDLQAVIFVNFGFGCIGQLLMLAYFGNAIESTSDKISNAIYESDWIDRDKEHKKNLIIVMTATKNPMKVKILKLFDVNLPSFVWVSFQRVFEKKPLDMPLCRPSVRHPFVRRPSPR
jgi:hypothetical protein